MTDQQGPALPWRERVTMLSIHPDAATRDDVGRLATELMVANQKAAHLNKITAEHDSQERAAIKMARQVLGDRIAGDDYDGPLSLYQLVEFLVEEVAELEKRDDMAEEAERMAEKLAGEMEKLAGEMRIVSETFCSETANRSIAEYDTWKKSME